MTVSTVASAPSRRLTLPAAERVSAFDVRPDGPTGSGVLVVAGLDDAERPRLWLVDTGTGAVRSEVQLSGRPHTVRLSPDGRLVAVSLGAAGIAVHDAATGQARHRGATDADASGLGWEPGSAALLVAAGRWVERWAIDADGLRRTELIPGGRGDTEGAMDVSVAPSGHLAIGTNRPAVYIARGGGQSRSLTPLSGAVHRVAWNTDGTLLATAGFGTGGAVAIWSSAAAALDKPFGEPLTPLATLPAPAGGWLGRPAWSPDGTQLAIGTNEGRVLLWSVDGTTALDTVAGAAVPEVAWSGEVLTAWVAHPDRAFRLWGGSAGGSEPPPAADATLVVTAIGPHAADARSLFAVGLSGSGGQTQRGRFDTQLRCTFTDLEPGRYRVVVDTKADVPWPVRPTRADVECTNGRTTELDISFG